MGASGAGKTTLLNVLTYRSAGQLHITGERCINGMPVGPKEVTAVSAYIQQEDLFFGTLTVYEHLVFYSYLRMDSKYTKKERIDKVYEVMEEVL
jgi:ABC-type multidrug transport system ATPase subunit